jgi:fluoride ion exporter CrcB/FEX
VLVERREAGLAALYVIASVALSLAAIFAGLKLGRALLS